MRKQTFSLAHLKQYIYNTYKSDITLPLHIDAFFFLERKQEIEAFASMVSNGLFYNLNRGSRSFYMHILSFLCLNMNIKLIKQLVEGGKGSKLTKT